MVQEESRLQSTVGVLLLVSVCHPMWCTKARTCIMTGHRVDQTGPPIIYNGLDIDLADRILSDMNDDNVV